MEHVGQSSQLNSVARQHRHNGLRTIVKYIVGATAVASIVGRALATEIAQQQPEQKGDVIEPKKDVVEQKGEQKKEVKSSGMFSFGKKSKTQDPHAANIVDITKTSKTKKTELKDLSMTVGKAERKSYGWPKIETIDLGPVNKYIFDTIAGMTKYNPGNANFGLSEYTIKTLNKNDTIEVPADIVQHINYVMHHKKDEETIRDYTYDFAYWFAHKLIIEGSGPRPKHENARKLWNANFKALKYHVLMSIPDEYKSGLKVKAPKLPKKDETEKAKKTKVDEVKKAEEVKKVDEVKTVSENAQ